jgi:phospholipid/cholesterol/gamma-HCH transport system substrate-binding protein
MAANKPADPATNPTEDQAAKPEVRSTRQLALYIVGGAFAMLGLLVALFVSVEGPGVFAPKFTVTTYFTNSAGLKSGAAVNLNGITIGTVNKVSLTTAADRRKTPVEVVMRINKSYQSQVHVDSLAELTAMGALADTVVDIDSKHAIGPPIQDGAELHTLNSPTVLDLKAGQATIASMNALVGRFNTVVDQMQTGNGSIGQLMSNPGLTNEAAQTARKAKQLTTKLNGSSNTVGKVIHDPSIGNHLTSISNNVSGITQLASSRTAPVQAGIATAQTQSSALMAGVNKGDGTIGMLMKDPNLSKKFAAVPAHASALITNYSANKGTGGNFAPGGTTMLDLAKLQAASAALSAQIRANPKKSLTIDFRIF